MKTTSEVSWLAPEGASFLETFGSTMLQEPEHWIATCIIFLMLCVAGCVADQYVQSNPCNMQNMTVEEIERMKCK